MESYSKNIELLSHKLGEVNRKKTALQEEKDLLSAQDSIQHIKAEQNAIKKKESLMSINRAIEHYKLLSETIKGVEQDNLELSQIIAKQKEKIRQDAIRFNAENEKLDKEIADAEKKLMSLMAENGPEEEKEEEYETEETGEKKKGQMELIEVEEEALTETPKKKIIVKSKSVPKKERPNNRVFSEQYTGPDTIGYSLVSNEIKQKESEAIDTLDF